eukprot:4041922-Amphidinium_carterae.1
MAVRYAPCLGSLVTSSIRPPAGASEKSGKSELVVVKDLSVDNEDVLLEVLVDVEVLPVNCGKRDESVRLQLRLSWIAVVVLLTRVVACVDYVHEQQDQVRVEAIGMKGLSPESSCTRRQ